MKKTKNRLAIIGVGKKVRDDHIPAIKTSGFFEIVALCDRNISSLQDLQDELQVECFETVE
jgi:predicted dehydrogenase